MQKNLKQFYTPIHRLDTDGDYLISANFSHKIPPEVIQSEINQLELFLKAKGIKNVKVIPHAIQVFQLIKET